MTKARRRLKAKGDPIPPRTRRVAAYHEAGHAVVAALHGLPLESVVIAKNIGALRAKNRASQSTVLGRTLLRSGSHSAYRKACARSGKPPLSPANWLIANAEHGLAGPAAERILTGRETGDGDDWGAADKGLNLARLALRSHRDSGGFRRTPLISTSWPRAFRTVKKHWTKVDALAKELLARGSLTGGEAHAVLRRVPRSH